MASRARNLGWKMKIAGSTESVLIVEITDIIQKASVDAYGRISFPEDWDKKVASIVDEKFQQFIITTLDGQRFSRLIEHYINQKILKEDIKLPLKRPYMISSLPKFENALDVAKKIVDNIKNIPEQFVFFSPVLEEFSRRSERDDVNIKISDRISLVSSNVIFAECQMSHHSARIDKDIKGWITHAGDTCDNPDHQLYFTYRVSGFLNKNISGNIVSEFYEEMRSFYGIVLNSEIIETGFIFTEKSPLVYANRLSGDGLGEFAFVTNPESDIVECFNTGTSTLIDEKLKQGESVEDILHVLQAVFQADDARRLKAAAAWLLRAKMSPRNLDKALYASICLEVLLGDRETSDRVGLSKLMANRCAYALGTDEQDRKNIINNFLEFYKLRSEIVHSGRTTMTVKERRLVNTGVRLASRMLSDEIRKIKK
jgi:hypothetical protein